MCLRHPLVRTLMHMFLVKHALRHCTIGIHAQESSVKTETGIKWKTMIEEVEDGTGPLPIFFL